MNSSETSAKYSCPSSEQKDEIHDSGVAEDDDMLEEERVVVTVAAAWRAFYFLSVLFAVGAVCCDF